MNKEATPIKEITKDIIKRLSSERLTKEERVRGIWKKTVGKRFCQHAWPTSFRRKRLVVSVDSSGWLYELTMRKQKIIAKLKKALKEDFKELQFRIGVMDKEERG